MPLFLGFLVLTTIVLPVVTLSRVLRLAFIPGIRHDAHLRRVRAT